MEGLAVRLFALVGALTLVTGVALATPVPVLTASNGTAECMGPLDDGEAMRYSYRQSIYDVPVWEEFKRDGDRIELLRIRSTDIRSIEYFRWDDPIVQESDGWRSEERRVGKERGARRRGCERDKGGRMERG